MAMAVMRVEKEKSPTMSTSYSVEGDFSVKNSSTLLTNTH
jgi:hypothetical protein